MKAWPWILSLGVACGDDPALNPAVDSGTPDAGEQAVADAGDPTPDAGMLADAGSTPDAIIVADAGVSDAGLTMDASTPDAMSSDAGGTSGVFTLLTYNVAGLPDVLSGSTPSVNTPLMSPLLNAYDIVVVQEDFAYHDDLISQATHPYQSTPSNPPGVNMGDGLNHLSIHSFSDYLREAWVECNGFVDQGSDCLTDKGFSVGRFTLSPGVTVEIYDVHFDAGRGQADMDARVAQIAQLVTAVAARPAGQAIIIAGDTNLKEDDESVLLNMLSTLGLSDACRLLSCPDPEHHDRVMYRNGTSVSLVAANWRLDPRFVDSAGVDLSDHPAVAVDMHWSSP